MRILFLGENWFGSCARACCYALRRMGFDVLDVDDQTIIPMLRELSSRAFLRLVMKRLIREYNEMVLDSAISFKPDMLLAFKGTYIQANTLRQLRKTGLALYNYFPDTSAFAHGRLIPESFPEYDCIFYTKRFFDRDVREKIKIRQSSFLPHGFDSEIHQPMQLEPIDIDQFGCDVSLIATYTSHKEEVLEQLVTRKSEIDLRIWGNQWIERCRSEKLKKHIQGTALTGSSYAKAIKATRINLGIMSGVVTGASRGDETSTRTYEIPACGGFMLHERTGEVLDLFEEGKEVDCFASIQELSDKIGYYLLHSEERDRIAQAGYARCVPQYSYDNRVMEIIQWHTRSLDKK